MAWHSHSTHPAGLAVRLFLELGALGADGWAGWHLASGGWRYPLVVFLPLLAATAWGVFNVPGDPSRSGEAPIPVPGPVRLAVEWAVFGSAVVLLAAAGAPVAAACFAALLVGYHLTAYDRVRWLLGRAPIPAAARPGGR
ncbi:MAG TPA: YrdB family protein [Streptomyces sp.]